MGDAKITFRKRFWAKPYLKSLAFVCAVTSLASERAALRISELGVGFFCKYGLVYKVL